MDSIHKNSTITRIFLYACLLLLPIVIALALLKNEQIHFQSQIQKTHNELLSAASNTLANEFGAIDDSARLTYSTIASQLDFISDKNSLDLELLRKQLLVVISTLENIMQIRWLDVNGQEIIRYDRKNGRVIRIPEEQLQNKGSRYYFQEAKKLVGSQRYFSPIDLNREIGVIERPFKPTVRVAMRAENEEGLAIGILVINYALKSVITQLRELSGARANLLIVDQEGFYILHSNKEKEWGKDLSQLQNNITAEFSEWKSIDEYSGRGLRETAFGLVSVAHVGAIEESNVMNLYLIASTPNLLVSELHTRSNLIIIVFGVLGFLIVLWLINKDSQYRRKIVGLLLGLKNEKAALQIAQRELKEKTELQESLIGELVQESKLSALGMMMAGLSHEMNTPLGAAKMTTGSLQRELEKLKQAINKGDAQEEILRMLKKGEKCKQLIEASIDRCIELTVSFKRLAIDRKQEEITEFQLTQVINDVLVSITPKLKHSNVKIINLINDDIVIRSSPGAVSQLYQNLILNAYDHAFDNKKTGEITLDIKQHETEIQLLVRDNGKGISPEDIGIVFDPFVTSKRSKGNTGLGLHLCYQITTKTLEGIITVESEVNKGTCFAIKIPLTKSDAL